MCELRHTSAVVQKNATWPKTPMELAIIWVSSPWGLPSSADKSRKATHQLAAEMAAPQRHSMRSTIRFAVCRADISPSVTQSCDQSAQQAICEYVPRRSRRLPQAQSPANLFADRRSYSTSLVHLAIGRFAAARRLVYQRQIFVRRSHVPPSSSAKARRAGKARTDLRTRLTDRSHLKL